jgi:hypothetical protein
MYVRFSSSRGWVGRLLCSEPSRKGIRLRRSLDILLRPFGSFCKGDMGQRPGLFTSANDKTKR